MPNNPTVTCRITREHTERVKVSVQYNYGFRKNKTKTYDCNIYLPFTTQERHQNTSKSVFTTNVHEIFMQYSTGAFACLRGGNAPPLNAPPSSLLDATKSWMPVLAVECIDRLIPKIPTASIRGWDLKGAIYPYSDSSSQIVRGSFAASSSIVYRKRIFCHMNSKGYEAGPWYWEKKVSCNSV